MLLINMDPIRHILIILMIATLMVLSGTRASIYENEVTLYTDIVSRSPNKARCRNNLGDALKNAGRFEEAGYHFEQALELSPNYPDALNNLATIYDKFGRKEDALLLLSQALLIDPDHLQARSNLAITFYEQGMLSEASRQYMIILDQAPNSKQGIFARQMLSLIQRKVAPKGKLQ